MGRRPKRQRARAADDRVRHSKTTPGLAGLSSAGSPALRPEPSTPHRWYVPIGVCAVIVLLCVVVFGQTAGNDFVNYDDPQYVLDNSHVHGGLTGPGAIGWAFSSYHANNWHPLTWLSHMLDVQLYGVDWAGGHHLSSLALHAASAILLFLLLWRMTARLWPAAFVAAIFAIHPLRVESVAWVAERKDVLSGLLFMLTLAAYLGYVRHRFSWIRYLAVVGLFGLGLMAKPMLVTVPCVLLLLDYWPLGRWPGGKAGTVPIFVSAKMGLSPSPGDVKGDCPKFRASETGTVPAKLGTVHGGWARPVWRLVLEKVPLFALSGASCIVTARAQGEAIASLDAVGPMWRVANAVVAYADYVGQLFLPIRLAAFYPHPRDHISAAKIIVAVAVVLGVSLGAWIWRRRFPYWFVGWFWYLGMLVPVIGVFQVGSHAMADRYTYLPQIGLCWALTWAAADLVGASRRRRLVCVAASTLAVAALAACAWRQTTYWHDSVTLWNHALACTVDSIPAHVNLGIALSSRGDKDSAIAHYQAALAVNPNHPQANNNLGTELADRGQYKAALAYYRRAVAAKPTYLDACRNMGHALKELKDLNAAIDWYHRALNISRDDAATHNDLGTVLALRGDNKAAAAEYGIALQINPKLAEARYNLGLALAAQGKHDEAIRCYRRVLELDPTNVPSINNWGSALARQGKVAEAVVHFRQALAMDPDYVPAHRNLAVALKQQGKTAEAIVQLRRVAQLQPDCLTELNELAHLLATSTQASLRNGAEAVSMAQRGKAVRRGQSNGARHAGCRVCRGGTIFGSRADRPQSDATGPTGQRPGTSRGDPAAAAAV